MPRFPYEGGDRVIPEAPHHEPAHLIEQDNTELLANIGAALEIQKQVTTKPVK